MKIICTLPGPELCLCCFNVAEEKGRECIRIDLPGDKSCYLSTEFHNRKGGAAASTQPLTLQQWHDHLSSAQGGARTSKGAQMNMRARSSLEPYSIKLEVG
jgi:hypothetical protein